MALTQDQVNYWFAQNPNATADEVAAAVKSVGGLDANAGLADMIANRYNVGANQVTDYYNQFTGGLPEQPTGAPVSNITTDYVKPSNAPTSGGVSNVIEGDDIFTQINQRPQEISHWARSADQRYMELIDDKTGQVLDRRSVGDFSDVDLVKLGLSMVPGASQVLGAVSALDAARKGDLVGAAIGATGLVPGMQNVNTALRVGQAASSGNTLGALTALAGNTDVQNLVGANNLTVGGYTAKDAVSAANLYSAAQNGNYAQVITNAGNLVNSPDTVLAGKALAVLKAAESGNPNALNLAVSAFNTSTGGGTSTNTGSKAVSDSAPLTADEIADLTPDQLRVYQEGGVSGLRDYNRAIKNMSSLTNTGYTGDYINDFTTGTSTGTTRSLAGTGALSTAGTLDDFENSEITRLRGLGMSNAQISDYLENLNNLTSSLDVTDTSGLSDFGLNAFRQAKAAGATDLEALAAANLAISGKYPTTAVETESGTEIIVTTSSETKFETETETFTGTELIMTSGRETRKETETETETFTGTELIVTTSSETKTETETETETETTTEIVVTTSSETETETETASESETETETLTEIVVTTASETHTSTETETHTEITITETRTETETHTPTETLTSISTFVSTKPTTTVPFITGPAAQGGFGKPIDFLKENLLKTYMTKQSFKDPLAEFNKARTEMMKENMMQQGVDPRLAAILAAKMNGEEPPRAPTYTYGEEPSSIDDILSLKGEGDQYYAQGGYVQPLMAEGGMALPLLAAKGGLPTTVKGREDFRDGKHVAGEGDGQSDDIPAMLADGEFVFPADVVSALGNGSTKAGTDKLYEMMHSIRDRARSKGPKDLPPPALKSPLDYLKKR